MHTRAAVVLATTILLAGCASPGKSYPAPNEGPSPIPEHLIRDWLDTNYRGADWTTAGISRIDDSPALTLVATTYPGDADAYRIGPGMCSAVRAWRLDHDRPGGVVSVLSAEGRRIGKC